MQKNCPSLKFGVEPTENSAEMTVNDEGGKNNINYHCKRVTRTSSTFVQHYAR